MDDSLSRHIETLQQNRAFIRSVIGVGKPFKYLDRRILTIGERCEDIWGLNWKLIGRYADDTGAIHEITFSEEEAGRIADSISNTKD